MKEERAAVSKMLGMPLRCYELVNNSPDSEFFGDSVGMCVARERESLLSQPQRQSFTFFNHCCY